MKTKVDLRTRIAVHFVTAALLFLPAAWAGEQPASSQQAKEQSQTAETPQFPLPSAENAAIPIQPASDQLPDSPGALQAQVNEGLQQQVAPQPQQQQSRSHEPLGTAAAEWQPVTGVAASRPAGAALAPAKQRRVRSIVIKVGALLGASAALGTVVALSEASPSKPPGAH